MTAEHFKSVLGTNQPLIRIHKKVIATIQKRIKPGVFDTLFHSLNNN